MTIVEAHYQYRRTVTDSLKHVTTDFTVPLTHIHRQIKLIYRLKYLHRQRELDSNRDTQTDT